MDASRLLTCRQASLSQRWVCLNRRGYILAARFELDPTPFLQGPLRGNGTHSRLPRAMAQIAPIPAGRGTEIERQGSTQAV